MDFKCVEIFPVCKPAFAAIAYVSRDTVTWYGTYSVATNALSMVAYGRHYYSYDPQTWWRD